MYFVRHTWDLDVDSETLESLWHNRMIAIHFPQDQSGNYLDTDNDSLNPNDYYGPGTTAMRALVKLAQGGGYVCAEYYGHDECLVGYIEPNSQIEIIEGTWRTRSPRQAILKGLSLQKVKVVDKSNQPVILVGRPRQGTIRQWHQVGPRIKNLVEGIKSLPDLKDLFPAQQETLCSEFMRLPESASLGLPHLTCLLLPVGRTLQDIDVYGMSPDGRKIFAQVTYYMLDHAKARDKLESLRKYSGEGNHLVFICRCDKRQVKDGILIVPIERVFESFTQLEIGKQWLQIGVPSIE